MAKRKTAIAGGGIDLKTQIARKRRKLVPAEWLDGDTWEIKQGEDFTCSVRQMQTDLHNIAQLETRKRGVLVKAHTSQAGLPAGSLLIQLAEYPDEPIPDWSAPKRAQQQAPTQSIPGFDFCYGDGTAHERGTIDSCPECGSGLTEKSTPEPEQEPMCSCNAAEWQHPLSYCS